MLALLTSTLLAAAAAAQATFRAEASSTALTVGSSLRVTFRLEDASVSGKGFEPPEFAGFEVLSGPNVSNSYTVVNGRTSRSAGIGYELLALEAGEYTLGPARITVDGATLSTDPLSISVRPAGGGDLDAKGVEVDAPVALRLRLASDTVYVGEEVRVEVELYNRERIHTYTFLRPLRFDGLRAEEISNFRARERRERIGGRDYAVRTLRAYDVYAGRAGTYSLGPAVVRAQLVTEGGRRRGFFFAPATEPAEAASDRRTLTVVPLPPGAPEGFTGAVGDWRFEGRYDDVPDLSTADALTFTLYAQGQGDIGRLTAPELNWPEGWRAYPPEQVIDRATETDTGTVYSRAYEYTLVPQRGGRFTLAPEVSHFDASRGGYVAHAVEPLTIDVRDAGGGAGPAADDGGAAALAPYRGRVRVARGLWVDEPWFPFALAVGPLLALLTLLAVNLRRSRSGRRAERAARRDPIAEGRRRLRTARAYLGEAATFYAEVRVALERYAEDRLGLPASRQSESGVRAAFLAAADREGLSAEDARARADRFLEARSLADRGLYGGGTDEAGRRAALAELEVLLS